MRGNKQFKLQFRQLSTTWGNQRDRVGARQTPNRQNRYSQKLQQTNGHVGPFKPCMAWKMVGHLISICPMKQHNNKRKQSQHTVLRYGVLTKPQATGMNMCNPHIHTLPFRNIRNLKKATRPRFYSAMLLIFAL